MHRCALPMTRRPGEQNAAITERLLVSPLNPRIELTFVSASFAASSRSTDLTSLALAQGSTQAFYLVLSRWPVRPSKASSRISPGMQYAERADGRALELNLDKT